MKEQNVKLKAYMAVAAFASSILFGGAAFVCPPLSIIDASILWFIAQLLCFSATLLGFSMTIDNLKQVASGGSKKKEGENEEKDGEIE